MNKCNCGQAIKLKEQLNTEKRINIRLNTSRTMRGVQIGELQARVKELEMVEQEYSKYIHIAWYAIQEAGYENFDDGLKKFMESENIILTDENMFCNKKTIIDLRRLIVKKDCEKDKLYLEISRLKQTLADWSIVPSEGE